jgi:hypothetical protein
MEPEPKLRHLLGSERPPTALPPPQALELSAVAELTGFAVNGPVILRPVITGPRRQYPTPLFKGRRGCRLRRVSEATDIRRLTDSREWREFGGISHQDKTQRRPRRPTSLTTRSRRSPSSELRDSLFQIRRATINGFLRRFCVVVSAASLARTRRSRARTLSERRKARSSRTGHMDVLARAAGAGRQQTLAWRQAEIRAAPNHFGGVAARPGSSRQTISAGRDVSSTMRAFMRSFSSARAAAAPGSRP